MNKQELLDNTTTSL